MGCDLSNFIIHFKESQIKIRPYTIEIRRSRQSDKKFDHVQAKMPREAGQKIIDDHIEREPIEIIADSDGNKIYRGFYKAEGAELGRNDAILEVSDPRRILTTGAIDKEWNKITLEKVVNYIYDRKQDPHDVITGIRFDEDDIDTEKTQHLFEDDDYNTEGNEQNGEPMYGLLDSMKEVLPHHDGDGNFDFREESPYSALLEVTNLWETKFWVEQNGTLVIGHPDISATVYPAGRGRQNWHISEWSLPANPTPLKAVVLKGKMDQKGGKDNDLEELWNIVTDKKKFETRAAAGFLDDDSLEQVVVLDGKKQTTDPKVLKRMARAAFFEHHTMNNKGSITINPMVDNEVPISDYAGMDIGDKLFVNNYKTECDNHLKEGLYGVSQITHEIDGKNGWRIKLSVNKAITKSESIKERFWYFDPTDSDMADNNPADDQSSV